MISEFWQWFAEGSVKLAHDPQNPDVIGELDRRVAATWPGLAWEIGPDPSGAWYLALSPNLDRERMALAEEAVASAPPIPGWRLYSARQRKLWDGRFVLETAEGDVELDVTAWRYVLLDYPDKTNEVLLFGPQAEGLTEDQRWHAAATALEGMLGEQCVLDHVDSFALESTVSARFQKQAKPIDDLPRAFGRVVKEFRG